MKTINLFQILDIIAYICIGLAILVILSLLLYYVYVIIFTSKGKDPKNFHQQTCGKYNDGEYDYKTMKKK